MKQVIEYLVKTKVPYTVIKTKGAKDMVRIARCYFSKQAEQFCKNNNIQVEKIEYIVLLIND